MQAQWAGRERPHALMPAGVDTIFHPELARPATAGSVIGNAATHSAPQLTLNVINITGEERRSNFYYDNAVNDVYDPGTTVMLGIRGSF